jgi:sigma-B regulation protein RsbU (phosphoserine phosphatase)
MTTRRLWLLLAILALLAYRVSLAYYSFLGPSSRPASSAQAALLAFAVHLWVPLLSLAAAAFVGLLRPHDGHALRAAFMFLSFALVFAPEQDVLPPGWSRAVQVAGSLASALALPLSVLLFFFLYPSRSTIDLRMPWLKLVLPAGGLALLLLVVFPGPASALAGRVLFFWIGAQYGLAMSALGLSWGQAKTPDEKRRLLLLYLGASAGVLPLFAIVLAQRLQRELPVALMALLVLTLGLFPLSFVYVVVKHRVFGIRPILRRGLQYALVSRGFVLLEALLLAYVVYAAVRHATSRAADLEASAPLLTGGLTLGLALALPQLNRRVFPAIDRRFFRAAYDARQLLVELSGAVRRLSSRPGELLDTVKRHIQRSLHPRFVTVLLRDPRWSVLAPEADHPLLAEGVAEAPLAVAGRAAQAALLVSRIAAQAGDPEPRPVSFRVPPGPDSADGSEGLLVPIASGGGLLGFLALGEKLSEEPYSSEDRELLTTVAEQTAVALENALLFREVAEQERLRREVEIARDVQGQLFPKVFPPLPSLRYCGSCRPARAVGGDYYDFIALGRSRLGIALGDIAGKGISAALLMTSLHAMLRSHALLGSDDLGRLVTDINRLLYEATDAARYATFFYGVYEAESRRLSYVNAGHIPPILVRPHDPSGIFHRLCEGGPVIGLLPDPAYAPGSIAFQPGDVLVIVSDGVSEAEDPAGDMFGEERVAQLAAAHAHDSETEIHDRIVSEVTRFRDGVPQGDDMTLIVAKVS